MEQQREILVALYENYYRGQLETDTTDAGKRELMEALKRLITLGLVASRGPDRYELTAAGIKAVEEDALVSSAIIAANRLLRAEIEAAGFDRRAGGDRNAFLIKQIAQKLKMDQKHVTNAVGVLIYSRPAR